MLLDVAARMQLAACRLPDERTAGAGGGGAVDQGAELGIH